MNRRQFLTAAVASVAAAAIPVIPAVAVEASPVAALPAFTVHRLREYYGNGEFGSFTGVYTRGHVDPARFVGQIDMDDLVELMGEPEVSEDDDADLILIANAEAELPARVVHGYARRTHTNPEYDDEEDDPDEEWFVTCLEESEGAFPVTMLGDL